MALVIEEPRFCDVIHMQVRKGMIAQSRSQAARSGKRQDGDPNMGKQFGIAQISTARRQQRDASFVRFDGD